MLVFSDRASVPLFTGADVQANVLSHVLELAPDKILLVCDDMVDHLHGEYFRALTPRSCAPGETPCSSDGVRMRRLVPVERHVLPQGDECKSQEHLAALMEWAFGVEATAGSLVVAFGGGAVLNVAGLFASMLYGGVNLVYVPTTFLAMHAVVTSLKTSISCDARIDSIGSFYAPVKVLTDLAFCRTLSRIEIFSGFGELTRNAVLLSGEHASELKHALSREQIITQQGGSGEEFAADDETLANLMSLGIEAKMSVIHEDAYEKEDGMMFEYGNTMANAIRKAYGYRIVPNGLAIVYGMLCNSYVAERLGIMAPEDRTTHDECCKCLATRFPLPEPKPSMDQILNFAKQDSKRGIADENDDEISDVLLRRMGDVVRTDTQMLSKFPAELCSDWLVTQSFQWQSEIDAQAAEPDESDLAPALVGQGGWV